MRNNKKNKKTQPKLPKAIYTRGGTNDYRN